MPEESLLTHLSLGQEERGRPPSSDPEESSLIPSHPQRPADSRMRKLFASHRASKHTSVQVAYMRIVSIPSETFQPEDPDDSAAAWTHRLLFFAQVSDWEAVVYGKTEDQLIMTEQARQYLNPYPAPGSTSRALVL